MKQLCYIDYTIIKQVSFMQIQQLHLSNYVSSEMESSGSFFTSIKFISTVHCHDFFELCLITEGKVIHFFNGKKELLGEGSFLFIRPEDVHFFEGVNNQYFQFINLAIAPNVIHHLLSYLGEGFRPERFLNSSDPIVTVVPKAEVFSLKATLEHFILIPRYDAGVIKSDLRAVLVNLLTHYFPMKLWENKTSVPIWLDWVYKEMQKKENFTGGISTMQKIACKSPEHLCREFKKYFNKTPTHFINDTRLNYSKNLLTFSDEKIIDVAYSSGFQNLSHFCHEFKKKYLMSPTAYRELYQNVIGSEKV
jgi:AraC family transcriptional regulator, dual regulator of chb operon